ncbi:MAG: carboxyltransferase domain-containing protein [Polyangiales bacterium]
MSATPLGDRAVVFDCDSGCTRATLDAIATIEGVIDVAAAEREVLCVIDAPLGPRAIARIEQEIRSPSRVATSTTHELAVVYDGPDLEAVASAVGASVESVIRWHHEREYRVAATGFAPGWAYLAELDERLRVARRASPRERVAAGSVAIADLRTGIYPFAGPGGWNLIGSIADEWRAFDAQAGARLALGDRVRFAPRERRELRALDEDAPPIKSRCDRGLRVEWSEAPALVQDGGRRGALRSGIAAGGALWKGRLALANGALGQRWDAAAIELYGAMRLRAEGRDVRVSIDGEARIVRDGEAVTVARPERARVRYLAIEGGVDCTPQLGGRGQLLRAAIGGLDAARDRPIRRGDLICGADPSLLGAARWTCEERGDEGALDESYVVSVAPYRHEARFEPREIERFVATVHEIAAASDRTGARLRSVARRSDQDTGISTTTFAGAIQVSADGTPIVLGVDHPTVGGYPVLAVVSFAQLGPLLARRPGARVRYRLPL